MEAEMQPPEKRIKPDIFNLSKGCHQDAEEAEKKFREAIKSHPFYDNAHSIIDIEDSAVIRDGKGNIIGIYVRKGLPDFAASMAADVLRPAATKTTLRCTIYGGEAPNSGIAGYFDYRGSPIEYKSRKTSFTAEHAKVWPNVFPMVNYVSAIYKKLMPANWERQNNAIPDIVRINGSPFSTLTINSRFRTASHTDAGDFDAGYGCIACLEGEFKGMALTFDNFKVNVPLRPGDVLLFDTHHFHSNTEVELNHPGEDWSRLTCVFYYRSLLGEPWSYGEYRRRLQIAKQLKIQPPPCVDEIIEKDNGENLNKSSVVHPIQLTPFSIICVSCLFPHLKRKAEQLHQWLLQTSSDNAEKLFGETLSTKDGIPERKMEDTHFLPSSYIAKAPALGGFSETSETIEAACKLQEQLDPENLSRAISPELFEMWSTCRARWLEKVKGEWAKMTKRNPDRKDFTWNNRSEMNSDFFDLCEVAKQVMLALLHKESATPTEESSFWTLFAAHIKKACESELLLPTDAMSLRKLNVKLKDFNFGGTRYFKDMPEEEKARRLERQKRIEEARRRGAETEAEERLNWLENDTFDYQTEDRVVDFAGNQWPLPEEHANAVAADIHTHAISDNKSDKEGDEDVLVVVVLPTPSSSTLNPVTEASAMNTGSTEYQRLMCNPAALRIQQGATHGPESPTRPEDFSDGKISVRYVYANETTVDYSNADFVLLQHVLCTMKSDEEAVAYLKAIKTDRNCVLIKETDLFCRRFFVLTEEVKAEYEAVAESSYKCLLSTKYHLHVNSIRIRNKYELNNLLAPLQSYGGRFKFQGSPFNSTILVG